MEVSARPASADDLAVTIALCEEGMRELRPHRGGEMWTRREARVPPYDESIAASFGDRTSLVVIGTIDGEAVGYACVSATRLHDGATVGDLTDLYTLPDARGVGVGEAMMELVVDWCRTQGCVGIDSIALPGDRATKNFFETFGLVARALRVHRPL